MITTLSNRVQYSPNGSTIKFAYPFIVLDQAHLQVVVTTAGVDSTKVLTTDYTVDGVNSQSGGNINFLVAPAAGTRLTISRVVPVNQLVQYVTNDRFPAKTHEGALDKLTMLIQLIQDSIDRSIKFPLSEPTATNPVLADKSLRLSTLIGFNASGDIYLYQIDPVLLTLTVPTVINTSQIANLAVTDAKLAAVLNLSAKTITYPNLSVPAGALAGTLDLSTKSIIYPKGYMMPEGLVQGIFGLDKVNPSLRIAKRVRIGFGPGSDGLGNGAVNDPVAITVSGAGSANVNGTYVKTGITNARSNYVFGTITLQWNAGSGWWEFYDSVGPTTWYVGTNDVTTPEQVVLWSAIIGNAPIPTVELDITTEVLEINGRVKATQFIGDGSLLTGFQENIQTPIGNQEGGTRTWYRGLAAITSRGELWTSGDDATYSGRGGHGNAVALPKLKRALFKAGVDPINGVSDQLNGGTDTIVSAKLGLQNALALSASGILYASGLNTHGQLGQGDTTARSYFSSIRFGSGAGTNVKIVSYSIGTSQTGFTHCAAIDINGQVWLWGYDGQGQLGDSLTADRTRPFKLSTVDAAWVGKVASQVLCVGQEDGSTFIVDNTGAVWGAGYNAVGQLCRGNFTVSFGSFAQCGVITGIQQVWARGRWTGAVSDTSVYALKSDGTLYSWGYNANGELGNGNTTNQNTVQNPVSSVSKFMVGGDTGGFCVAVRTDNSVRTWGFNNKGQLGDASTTNRSTPVVNPSGVGALVQADNGCKRLICGGGDTGGFIGILTNAGNLYVAGYNGKGQLALGDATDRTSFTKSLFSRATLSDVIQASEATEGNILGMYTDKTCWASGENTTGHLSLGHSTDAWIPQRISLL